jgi:hypothetical protein
MGIIQQPAPGRCHPVAAWPSLADVRCGALFASGLQASGSPPLTSSGRR